MGNKKRSKRNYKKFKTSRYTQYLKTKEDGVYGRRPEDCLNPNMRLPREKKKQKKEQPKVNYIIYRPESNESN